MYIAKILNQKIQSGDINIDQLLKIQNDFNPIGNKNMNVLLKNIDTRLTKYPKSSFKKITYLLNLTEKDIYQKEIYKLNRFNIFGSPDSTDIDIAFIVDSHSIIEKFKFNQIELDFNGILDRLKIILKKNKFDVNLIAIDQQNNIIMALKGSKETQNIIFMTYQYHYQEFPCFFDKMIDIDVVDKIRGLSQFVLQYLVDIIGKQSYESERLIKKKIYNDSASRLEYVNSVLKIMSIDINRDVIKAIVMKLIQIILLNDDEYAYTKKEMIEKIINYVDTKHINIIAALWNLLLRDNYIIQSSVEDKQHVFTSLVSIYLQIYDEIQIEQKWYDTELELYPLNSLQKEYNPTTLSTDIFREFMKSPLKPSDRFMEICGDLLNNIDVNFILYPFGQEFIPEEMNDHVIFIPQRSKEWKEIHAKYNYEKIKINFDKYGLLRGAIGEILIIKKFDFQHIFKEKINKCMVGFIKDDLGNICAPDLLLIKDKEIIPVEIKCLCMPPTTDITNKNFHREYKLAKKQIAYAKLIIDNIYSIKIKSGLIIFVFIDKEISIKYTLIEY